MLISLPSCLSTAVLLLTSGFLMPLVCTNLSWELTAGVHLNRAMNELFINVIMTHKTVNALVESLTTSTFFKKKTQDDLTLNSSQQASAHFRVK